MSKANSVIINGWCIFAHSIFLDQFEEMILQVDNIRLRDLLHYKEKNQTKRLAAVIKLIFEKIPNDPTLPEYRLGATLGKQYKHWFRVKFFQQYRIFFRYHLASKIIIYAWINDEKTKRSYDSQSDAYYMFKKMLKTGRPPDDWKVLLAEAQGHTDRFRKYQVNEP